METATTETEVIERLLAEPWRLYPHTFAEHVSNGRWLPWDYLAYISERITEAIAQGTGRLIINIPPGHGKSELLSHWLPTWFLDNLPHRKVILASHSAELAENFGRVVRNEFERNELLETRLSEDSSAAGRWNTPQGGGMVTTGVGGGITGFRGDLILVDDPHPTWEAVNSETHRKRVAEWFDGTLRDRAEPGATMVVLMHRWHPQDLVGQLLEKHADEWRLIRLPALAESDDPIGRPEGAALCPQRFDVPALAAIKRAVGSLIWSGKYGQLPTSPEGDYFKREWFEVVAPDRVPSNLQWARSWDLAATAEEGNNDPDWLAGCLMGKVGTTYYIRHVQRARVRPQGVENLIVQQAAIDGHETKVRIEQEGGASGKLLGSYYTRLLDGYDCRFVPVPKSSKLTRSAPFNAACERKDVKLVNGEWVQEFLDELAQFPNGAHDDQVDSAVGAYTALTRGMDDWDATDFATVFARAGSNKPKTPQQLLLEKLKGGR